jgi:hypothetical protein
LQHEEEAPHEDVGDGLIAGEALRVDFAMIMKNYEVVG